MNDIKILFSKLHSLLNREYRDSHCDSSIALAIEKLRYEMITFESEFMPEDEEIILD